MRAAAPSSTEPPSSRRRAASLALTIAIHLLLLLMLVRLAPRQTPPPAGRAGPTMVTLLPNEAEQATPAPAKRAARSSAKAASARMPPPPPTKRPPLPPKETPPLNMLPIELASSDIGRLPSHPEDRATAASRVKATEQESGQAGTAGGGEKVYVGDWYRLPTDAELAPYLPHDLPPTAWAKIICRMVENYHVDNCQAVAESPSGSGYANALRKASWQFLVRPTRVGNKVLVGSLVEITFAPAKFGGAP